MRRAFTLVEMLIVTVVIVTLMTIVFRLAGLGSSAEARNLTISRMQRLENCISGYYAAFGSYPPVKLHGSRNFYYEVNRRGIQQVESNPVSGFKSTDEMWKQVEAACRSQPVAMKYPYARDMWEYVKTVSEALTELHNSDPDSDYGKNADLTYLFDALEDSTSLSRSGDANWTDVQIFEFGLMSYLLPRFLVMMGYDNSSIYSDFAQWCNNNELPCKFDDGTPYKDWNELNELVKVESNSGSEDSNRWKVELLPSQAVTARWVANLEGQLTCERNSLKIYGVNLAATDAISVGCNVSVNNPNPVLYSRADSQGGTSSGDSGMYALDGITCKDGWGHDFYYYSPAPYQSYRLWSAGPNGKTFPPWVSAEEIKGDSTLNKYKTAIMNWAADDIVQMSN